MNSTFVTHTDGPLQPGEIAGQDSALLDAYSRTIVNVTKKVSPSIVQIKVRGRAAGTPTPNSSVPRQRRPKREDQDGGTGSGFIISTDGYLITNDHVVAGAAYIQVSLEDSRDYEATLIGHDPATDIAVLKIYADGLKTIRFANSKQVQVGHIAIALGNPYGFQYLIDDSIGRPIQLTILRENRKKEIRVIPSEMA